MEVLRYNCPKSTYTIHCAFPADFMSPGFILEQKTKTPLNKKLQRIVPDADVSELESRYPSSERVASLIISAVDKGDFIICPASFASSALFCNMIGPSPKRGWDIIDSLLSVLTGWFVWPILRRRWEAVCRKDGEDYRLSMT
jgi:3-dehydrosphinganine reductase